MKTLKNTFSAMLGITTFTAIVMAASFSSAAFAQTVPDLGEAEQFAVLAGSTVTNTGSTTVTGELGVSPGTAITGFPPGIVSEGQIRSNDSVAAQAVADLLVAYNDLAGQPVTTEQAAAMGAGMVLTPAVYHFTDAADITGSLVLDAQGDSTAVFVFQVEEALTMASDAEITLINGATAGRIFWQIGTSATLGTNSKFSGSILAGAGVTLNTGAVLDGRALAQTAVTLDSSTVTIPSGESGTTPPPTTSGPLPEMNDVVSVTGEPSSAIIKAGASADGGETYKNSFTTAETVTVNAELIPESGHVGNPVSVFVVIRYTPVSGPEEWLMRTEAGAFVSWNQDVETLQSVYTVASMGTSVSGEVFSGTLDAGVYDLYIGYAASSEQLIYNESPMSFTVTGG